ARAGGNGGTLRSTAAPCSPNSPHEGMGGGAGAPAAGGRASALLRDAQVVGDVQPELQLVELHPFNRTLEAIELAAIARPELLGDGVEVGRDGGHDGAAVLLGLDQAERRLFDLLELDAAYQLDALQERLDASDRLREVVICLDDRGLGQQAHLRGVGALA